MKPLSKYKTPEIQLYWGDAIEVSKTIPEHSVQSVITSPTYWGKRQFTDDKNEFGSESLEEYVERNVTLYSLILERLLKDDGSLFVIIQDTYMGSGGSRAHHTHFENLKDTSFVRKGWDKTKQGNTSGVTARHDIIQNKSLCGIPFRIANQLVDKGYLWRQTIVWEKTNPQPEPSADDRAWQSMEYILHFTKSGQYKFNKKYFQVPTKSGSYRMPFQVWKYTPKPDKEHSATFPKKLGERLMLTTTDKGDAVFDPFLGSGTMMKVARDHKRKFIGCDIHEYFVDLAVKEIKKKTINSFFS